MSALTGQETRTKAYGHKASRLGSRSSTSPPPAHQKLAEPHIPGGSASSRVDETKKANIGLAFGSVRETNKALSSDDSASDSESSEASQDEASSDSSSDYLDAQTMARILAAHAPSQAGDGASVGSDLVLPGASDKPLISAFRTQRHAPSLLHNRLAAFLPEMAAANAELDALKKEGVLGDKVIDDYKSDDEEGGGQYIEMDLGLGVLEDKNNTGETSEEEQDEQQKDGKNTDDQVMDNLMGRRKPKSHNQTGDEKAKPGIEEV